MINKLRTQEQGADTMVWMCCYPDLEKLPNGAFFQDRTPVAKHLPLAWTHSSLEEEVAFMNKLDELYAKFSS
jgi:dehydrogenase/reductase SDR family protein 12